MPVPIPNPSFLDNCIRLKTINGERRWGNDDGTRIYTWDSLHGEIEVYKNRGACRCRARSDWIAYQGGC